jgi:hypothetical protein
MANSRVVSTHFWKDSYIIDLNKDEKLLFIYFLTNPRTTLAGIYEISVREIAFDTGLEAQQIMEIITKFTRDGRILFERNWLVLPNFLKHQRLNPSIIRGVEKAIEELPEWLQQKIYLNVENSPQLELLTEVEKQTGYSMGTVSPQYKVIKSNLNKIKEKKKEADKPLGSSEELSKTQKRNYAKASEADREQVARARKAFSRTSSKPESLDEIEKAYEKRTVKNETK